MTMNELDKISMIIVEMKLNIITKNMQSIRQYSFSKNRFYGMCSSKGPTACVGVNNFQEHFQMFFIAFFCEISWVKHSFLNQIILKVFLASKITYLKPRAFVKYLKSQKLSLSVSGCYCEKM